MPLVLLLGGCAVLAIMTTPLRLFSRSRAAGFGSKCIASALFCLAGLAAAGQRATLPPQAAALLLAMFFALVGDVLLALEPLLASPAQSRPFVFLAGAVPFLLAHVLNLAVLLHLAPPQRWMLAVLLLPPLAWALLWGFGVWKPGAQGAALLVYAAVLGGLLAAAAHLARQGQVVGWLALPASLLFLLSDSALFTATFGAEALAAKVKRRFSFWVMLPYYLAQGCMAVCVLFV
ncbi:MAG: lysoplasmalogenase [Oscillospiraceae bacterium]|jgi:hypothetical protein|nr:lysoplasmalogenase [Oscillospiraceae bacterium]